MTLPWERLDDKGAVKCGVWNAECGLQNSVVWRLWLFSTRPDQLITSADRIKQLKKKLKR
jgi:hypothetical protein